MNIQVESKPSHEIEADWLVVGVPESDQWDDSLQGLDKSLDGSLTRLRESGDLTGKPGNSLAIYDASRIASKRLLLVGLGEPDSLNVARYTKAMSAAAREVSGKKDIQAAIVVSAAGSLSLADSVEIAATAFTVGCVGQDLYRAEPAHFRFAGIQIVVSDESDEIKAAVRRGSTIGQAINLTRELVNRPAQDIYPESFAERAESVAADCGLTCEVWDEKRLKTEKMESLLGVAQGSDRPPRMVVLEHNGGGVDAPVLALVGKGVTFDSGGLSIKTGEGMKEMKCDMAGAATVLGAMTAIARLKIPVNVRGYMGLVENMISGNSYKLGDVLTARNGVTIEVLNTDAEGRLVLADVLAVAVDCGAAKLIDLATLTGACMVALGDEVTGVFSNQQQWCDQVLEAARTCGEPAWQLPMFDFYAELLKSDVADVKNIGSRWGGAITAAKFLEKFVAETPWVHLDIAGPSFASSNKPHREGGASGCMVRTLIAAAEKFGSE